VEESAVGVVVADGLVRILVVVVEQLSHHITLELADESTHVLTHTHTHTYAVLRGYRGHSLPSPKSCPGPLNFFRVI